MSFFSRLFSRISKFFTACFGGIFKKKSTNKDKIIGFNILVSDLAKDLSQKLVNIITHDDELLEQYKLYLGELEKKYINFEHIIDEKEFNLNLIEAIKDKQYCKKYQDAFEKLSENEKIQVIDDFKKCNDKSIKGKFWPNHDNILLLIIDCCEKKIEDKNFSLEGFTVDSSGSDAINLLKEIPLFHYYTKKNKSKKIITNVSASRACSNDTGKNLN